MAPVTASRTAPLAREHLAWNEFPVPDRPIEAPSCWRGPEWDEAGDWIYRLSPSELAELAAAVRHVNDRGLDILEIGREDFSLPTFGAALAGIKADVLSGRGFSLLRGLPVTDWSRRDAAIAYWGIGAHLGYPVCQNARGHVLGHVYDLEQHSLRRYATNLHLDYHSDFCDIVGLLCLHSAKRGGESYIASAAAIHNEILATRPDLLRVLYQPFWTDRRGEIPAGGKPYYQLPVFYIAGGRPAMMYHRLPILMSERYPELPRLTPQQKDALSLIDKIAADPAFHLPMSLQTGDIQLLNNLAVIHARNEFEDHPEPEKKRHLLRLWLVTPEAQELSYWHYRCYGSGRRGGIYVAGVVETAPLDP
jgi:hypothetical protein